MLNNRSFPSWVDNTVLTVDGRWVLSLAGYCRRHSPCVALVSRFASLSLKTVPGDGTNPPKSLLLPTAVRRFTKPTSPLLLARRCTPCCVLGGTGSLSVFPDPGAACCPFCWLTGAAGGGPYVFSACGVLVLCRSGWVSERCSARGGCCLLAASSVQPSLLSGLPVLRAPPSFPCDPAKLCFLGPSVVVSRLAMFHGASLCS